MAEKWVDEMAETKVVEKVDVRAVLWVDLSVKECKTR